MHLRDHTISQPAPLETIGLEVTAFTHAQSCLAVATLVQAFAEDPVAVHLFADPEKRKTGMAHIFRMGLSYGQKYGRVDVINSAGAVAVWIRPEYTKPSWVRMLRSGFLATPFTVGWVATRRMLMFGHFIEACRARSLGVPHWYLFCVGARPELQGQGLGAALLRHGLNRAQAAGVPCYLETANAHNLHFYKKHGFRVMGEKQLPRNGPGVWSLVAGNDQ